VIREHHAELLASGTPHAPGGCAFLDDGGGCRIYAQRPYVCRTQGLPLRWIEGDEAELVEVRDICPLNADGSPTLEELPAEACWPIGPIEARLRQRQAMEDGGREERSYSSASGTSKEPRSGERVALRGLFSRAPEAPPRRLPIAR
jgi:hypothetical protein